MNSVTVAGVVVGQWRQDGDYVIRLSVERGLAPESVEKEPSPNFVTIQLPPSLFGDGPVDFSPGQLIELVGQAGAGPKKVRSRRPQMMWRR